jgi:hypothetical protein
MGNKIASFDKQDNPRVNERESEARNGNPEPPINIIEVTTGDSQHKEHNGMSFLT